MNSSVRERLKLRANPPFELSDVDCEVLGQTDEEFVPHTWAELADIIALNDTSLLRRSPSGLANYIRWTCQTLKSYDSVATFIRLRTLGWARPVWPAGLSSQQRPYILSAEETPAGKPTSLVPFEHCADYRILRNDWPYGLERDIVHLVVWLKNRIPLDEDAGLGDPSRESMAHIEHFVERTFRAPLKKLQVTDADAGPGGRAETVAAGREKEPHAPQVMWFRNRVKNQSVRALEHVHVLLQNVPEKWVEAWTGQNVGETLCERWARGDSEDEYFEIGMAAAKQDGI